MSSTMKENNKTQRKNNTSQDTETIKARPVCKINSVVQASRELEINKTKPRIQKYELIKTVELETTEYDEYTHNLLDRKEFLENLETTLIIDGFVKITAPNRQPIYVDPQGYNYAKYYLVPTQ